MSDIQLISDNKIFDGSQRVYSHISSELNCSMNFGIFIPSQVLANPTAKSHALFYLSGLTCTEANFIQKSGFQRCATKHGFVVVNPDTSPRGCHIDGESDSWDFGVGASFYVDATEPKWAKNFRMYSYVCNELPKLIAHHFNVDINSMGIFGHSMGGHGALICALRNPNVFRSVSAFAPICNPSQCPWGRKAFAGYLSTNETNWKNYDACSIVADYDGPKMHILIDQGDKDEFLKNLQLLPENFADASSKNPNIDVHLRLHKDYDHSYFFISTFIEQHFDHHANILKNR